jgi:hypothetical protein
METYIHATYTTSRCGTETFLILYLNDMFHFPVHNIKICLYFVENKWKQMLMEIKMLGP